MKKYPSLVPYIIKRHSEIDPITGDKKWDYTEENHLYDVEEKRILMQETPFADISYIDYSFEDSTALVIKKIHNGVSSYTIIDTKNDLGNPLWFDELVVLSPKLIIARRNNLYGIIDSNKTIKIFFEYEYLSAYRDPLVFVAKKDGKFGVITIDNHIILPFKYYSITHNSRLGILVCQDTKVTILYNILDGSISTIPYGFKAIESISEGIAVLKLDSERYVLYDLDKMKLINNYSYRSATPMINGFSLCSNCIIVNKDGSSIKLEEGFYHKDGEVVYKTDYVEDDNWKITTYIKDKFISSFIHKKEGYGVFSCGCYMNKYLCLSAFSDKYSIHGNIRYFDLYGNPLDFNTTHKIVETEKDKKNKEKIDLTERITRGQSNLHLQHRLDYEESTEFIKEKFPDGLPCDEPYIYEIADGLYHITTVDWYGDGPSSNFYGYMIDGKKLWQVISIKQ